MIPIDKDVPMPNPTTPDVTKYPWMKMEIGDSFFVEGSTSVRFNGTKYAAQKQTGRKFTIRRVEGGIRVWRTA